MKHIKYLLIITLLAGAASCSKEKLPVWNTPNKLYFANEDTLVTASFKKQAAGVNEFTVKVPVQMLGTTAKQERKFTVEVLKDKRNPQTSYQIVDAVVPADSARGFLMVKVTKTANLSDETDTVNFVIRAAGEFETGLVTNLRCTMVITNKYTKPVWWNDYYCGIYSEAKHEVLFAVLGNDNDIRGGGTSTNINAGWTHVDALYNIWRLNNYCTDHNLPFRFANGR